ncbi:MAG: TauD/TfdA family dioxygenase [Pseudomonadota bacterium]
MARTVNDATVWYAKDVAADTRWRIALSSDEVAELCGALDGAHQRSYALTDINPETFPLPAFGKRMAAIRAELESGRGFAVLTGLPVDAFSYTDSTLVFAGICAQLGMISAQTANGTQLIDVVDKGVPWDAEHRGYDSRAALNFHTDGADVAGLLCLSVGASGGDSFVASASAIYNEIARAHPHLLDLLEVGFRHHRRGEQPEGESPVSREPLPVFRFHDDLLHCCYNRNAIEWAARAGEVLSDRQSEALDVLEATVNHPNIAFRHRLHPGDMSFVNNYAVLHARDEYHDSPTAKRHLIRLWVNDPTSRRLGPTLQNLYAPDDARFQVGAAQS